MMKGQFLTLLLLSACAFCACEQGNNTGEMAPSPEPEPGTGYLTITARNGEPVTSFDLSIAAFSKVLVVRSDRDWDVRISGNETDWLPVETTPAAAVQITVPVNTQSTEREAMIVFSTSDGAFTTDIPIRQAGSEMFGAAPVRDMLLVYVGDPETSRSLDKERFKKLVAAQIDGNTGWLFDGFIFTGNYYRGRSFMTTGKHAPTVRQDWLDMLDYLFDDEGAIPALEEALEEAKASIPGSFHRRKIAIFMPDPQLNQTDWGEIDGQAMDFSRFEDRITACRWYVDRMLEKFASREFRNIQLCGVYWLTENGGFLPQYLNQVAEYIHGKGLYFYWIPYYEAFGYDNWEAYGFDRAWYQPNYLFQAQATRQRLVDACRTAGELGMSVEAEFDSSYPLERNADYIDVYERLGVFDNLDLTYYGESALEYWQDGLAPERALFERIAGIIIERQKKQYDK